MSKKDLVEILKTEPMGKNYLYSLYKIKEKAEPILDRIIESFPEYTSHNIKHSEQILRNLNWLIPDSIKDEMNVCEIFFLICATYLHDIGMVNLSISTNFPLKKETSKNQTKLGEIRENHNLWTEEFIIKNYKTLAIENEHQARIIGRICRGHRKENLFDKELFNPERFYLNYSINVPFLSSLLRLADELDITFKRAPQVIYDLCPPKDKISREEWDKHLSIAGVGIPSKEALIIKASATCKNHKIHRALRNLESKVNNQLLELPDHLYNYKRFRKDLPRFFLIEVEAVGYKFYDFKFSLQEKEIITILMGEKLYERKEESLRELLKNSIDGVKLWIELSEKLGLKYNPEIVFKLTPNNDKLIITDNGVGMDEEIIERYFTKIGKSFYTSPEFLQSDIEFTPVSELGIGILSCFMISNRILIETKTHESDSLLIEIDDVSDYFFVREGKRLKRGTSITLFLKEEMKEEIDLPKEIRYFARHLEFPIKVIVPNSKDIIIRDQGFNLELKSYKNKDLSETIGFHLIKVNNDYVTGEIALILEKNEELGLIPVHHHKFYKKFDLFPYSFLSLKGIFIGDIKILPEFINRRLFFVDLNFKKKIIDLTIARNHLVQNDKLNDVKRDLEICLFQNFDIFLINLKKGLEKLTDDFGKVIKSFFDENFESWTLKRMFKKEVIPIELLNLIKKHYYFKCVMNNEISFLNYDQIIKKELPIYYLNGFSNYYDNHIRQIISCCSGFSKKAIYVISDSYIDSFFLKVISTKAIFTFFSSFLEIEVSDKLKGIILKSWKCVKFCNYKTYRLIEFTNFQDTLINIDNPFIDLLIKHTDFLTGNRKLAVEAFFRTLKVNVRSNFQELLKRQKILLKLFVDADLISEEEIKYYLLTKESFPPHMLKKLSI